jgi:GNAT superfamily N-acetyltransferase
MKIRRMRESEIDFALRCTTKEDWRSETRESFESFFEFDAEGCFIAESNDRSIGICVATSYGSDGFIGELIVIEEMRGRGVGRQLLEHAIHYLESRGAQNIFLDGDLPAVPLYERVGFRKICRSLRFTGRIRGKSRPNVRPMMAADLEAIRAMDREAFGADRFFFLDRRFERHPELCRVSTIRNTPTGFIMGLPGRDILSVGPWIVRENHEDARHLLEDLARKARNIDLRIGILETNQTAVDLVLSYESLESGEPSWRMARGPSARLGASGHCYAIGTAAKG